MRVYVIFTYVFNLRVHHTVLEFDVPFSTIYMINVDMIDVDTYVNPSS